MEKVQEVGIAIENVMGVGCNEYRKWNRYRKLKWVHEMKCLQDVGMWTGKK